MRRVRELVPRRPTLACLAVCGSIVLAAAVDYGQVESKLPDVGSPRCDPATLECFNQGRREQIARNRAAEPLAGQFNSRAWLYAFAILTVSALATASALRVRPRPEWPRVFTNLGAIGVWVGIAAIVLLVIAGDASIEVRAGPTLTVPVALLGTAAAGTIIGRSEEWAETSAVGAVRDRAKGVGRIAIHLGTAGTVQRTRPEQLAGWLSAAALGLTALTVLLAVAFIVPQPACGGGDSRPPGWTSPIDSVAAVTGIGAIAAGVGALVLRRWIAALVSLVVDPIALLLIVASTCAFY